MKDSEKGDGKKRSGSLSSKLAARIKKEKKEEEKGGSSEDFEPMPKPSTSRQAAKKEVFEIRSCRCVGDSDVSAWKYQFSYDH